MALTQEVLSSLLTIGGVNIRTSTDRLLNELITHPDQRQNVEKLQCLQILVNTWTMPFTQQCEESMVHDTKIDAKDTAVFAKIVQFSLGCLKRGLHADTKPYLLHLFGKCFPVCGHDCEEKAFYDLTKAFSDYALDLKTDIECNTDLTVITEGKLDIHTAVDLSGMILKTNHKVSKIWLDSMSEHVVKLVTKGADAEVSGKIVGIVVPKIISKLDDQQVAVLLDKTWESIEQIYEAQIQTSSNAHRETYCERPFLLLCGFANWFFPVDSRHVLDIPLPSRPKFWEVLQFGFFQNDSLTRKRALYILKRILDVTETHEVEYPIPNTDIAQLPVFSWTTETRSAIGDIWQDFFLLIETLEEKQVHVIKPLMPRFGALVHQTFHPADRPLLHTSWILTLLRRITTHESAFIKRWGFIEFLKIDMKQFPLIQQNGPSFLQNQLVALFAESNMYYKPTEMPLGLCPPVGEAIMYFLPTCLEVLKTKEEQSRFLGTFLHNMLDYNWSGSALVHVSRALANLPPTAVCGGDVVNDIREIIQLSMGSLEIYLRGALQCYMSSAVLRIIDPSSVCPSQLMPLLAILRWDESMARGSVLWKEYVQWLGNVARDYPEWSGRKLTEFIQSNFSMQGIGDQSKIKNKVGNQEVLAVVRLCLLSLDAGIFGDKESGGRRYHPVETVLRPVVATLLTVNTHAYMSATKAKHAINVMVTFLKNCESKLTCPEDNIVKITKTMMDECVGEVVLYSCRKLTEEADHLHAIEDITFHIKILESLGSAGINIFTSPHLKTLVIQLMAAHWRVEQPSMGNQLRRYAGMMFMGLVARLQLAVSNPRPLDLSIRDHLVISWNKKKPTHDFSRPSHSEIDGTESLRGQGNSTWGRVTAEFISGQWYCVSLLLNLKPLTQDEYKTMLEWCMEALNVTSGLTILPIIECLKIIIPKVDPGLLNDVVRFSWNKVMEDSRNTLSFWSCWKTFTNAIFQPDLINNKDERIRNILSDLMQEVFSMGEEKQGLVNIMMSRLCEIWKNGDYKNMSHYVDAVISAIVFGPIHDKSRKQSQESVAYLLSLGHSLAVNELKDGMARDDNNVRAMMLSVLSHLRIDEPAHQELACCLITKLPQKHKEINQMRTYRDFNNSLSHRVKHRIIVSLLVIEAFILKNKPEVIMEVLMDLLSSENHSSVRVMLEWLTIRVLLHVPSLFPQILKAIQKSDEKRMAYLCSLFTIATHVVKSTPTDKQEEIMLQLIPNLLPWCTMHHFNCRTFAQACIIMLWQTCQQQNLQTAIKTHSIIQNLVEFQKTNINQSKGTQKLLDNFFFHFDPIQDYSIETLLLTLPRLTHIQDDEWIHPNTFTHVDPSLLTDPASSLLLPLLNQRHVLEKCEPGTWKVKFVDPDTFEVTEGNVQKKIIPWISMLPEQDLESELEEEFATKRRRCGELILVTSLIDKVPNLGGLCRTSEIFGVSEFVIGNLKHTKVHEFESLSVTAHKWIPIKEVRPHMLKTYLLEMKNNGYTLVGAEQTADSVSLRDYTFPCKTLLVLGNEKEGIPIDLIQLLDVCVEIPQQGVIRSLNVHVSGALLVWEYTRQWLSRI